MTEEEGMATIRHHAHIERSPEDVWKVVSDAGAIAIWFPGIDRVADGDDRAYHPAGVRSRA